MKKKRKLKALKMICAHSAHFAPCACYAEALECLADGEDIISGLEAEADNAGINLHEVREWWYKAQRIIERAKA